jgi:WD40 repeat protein/serine/threonine protein kinase
MTERRATDTRSLSDDGLPSGPRTGAAGELGSAAGEDFPVVSRSHYELGEEFARGGSGRLLRARDRRLDRVVAIKEPRELSSKIERRFRREALLTARLQHPSIVPVHEIGRWPTGEPFYAMKLVSGRSLRDVVAETTTLAERIALVPNVLAVADAIAYAHTERVIHRDLKPSNVMVGAFGETQVIDWGLAKALDGEAAAGSGTGADPEQGAVRSTRDPAGDAEETPSLRKATVANLTGIAGTPSSMAPEQAAGKPLDERTDVYGIGAILYHVLAGGPPYTGDDPETVLERLVREPPPPVAERTPGVPRELVAIVERAMARDPADRYPSARELAADLRRFLAGQLVAAHDYPWWQLSWRFVRRHRVALGIAASSLVALVGFGQYSVRRILAERRIAVLARAQAETQRTGLLLSQAKLWMDRDPTVGLAWLKEYAGARDVDKTAISTLAADARARGVASLRVRDRRKATLAPDGVTLAAQAGDSLVVWRTDDAKSRALGTVATALGALQFSADSRAVLAAEGGIVTSYSLDGGRPREVFRADETIRQLLAAGPVVVAAGEHGTLWLIGSASAEGPPDGRARALHGSPEGAWTHLLSRDGKVLLSSSRSRALPEQLRVWHLPGGESESIAGKPGRPALSPDGALVAWGEDDGIVYVYDVAKRSTRSLRGHHDAIQHVAFSADGAKLASTSADRTVRVWDLATERADVLEGDTDWTMRVELAPDGRLLASSSLDRTVRVWDLATGDSQVLLGYLNPMEMLRFTPDSRSLVTADNQGEVRVWPVQHASDRVLSHDDELAQLLFLSDGRLLAADGRGRLDLWDPVTGAGARMIDPGGENLAAASAEGLTVVRGGEEGELLVRDLGSGASRRFPGHRGAIQQVALTKDGLTAATAGIDRTVRLWNTRTGEGRILGSHAAAVWHVAFSPDERTLVSAGDDLNLRLWSLDPSASASRELIGHTGLVYDLAFSPDGEWIASAGLDTTVRLWPAKGGESRVLRGHAGLVHQLAFAPDGRTLATASDDRTVRLWDVASGTARALDHGAGVVVVRFASDGQSVVSGTVDGVVRVWDLSGGLRSILRGRPAEIIDIAIAKDSRSLGVVGTDGAVRLWGGIADAPRAAATRLDLDGISSVAISGDDAVSP